MAPILITPCNWLLPDFSMTFLDPQKPSLPKNHLVSVDEPPRVLKKKPVLFIGNNGFSGDFFPGWLNCGTKNAVRKSGILLFFTPCYFLAKMLVHLSFVSSFDRTTLSSKSRTTNLLKTIQHVVNHESIIGSEVLIPNEW